MTRYITPASLDAIRTAFERPDAPARSRLVSGEDYTRMRGALTDLAALGIALKASVSDDELRDLVAAAVRRALGASI